METRSYTRPAERLLAERDVQGRRSQTRLKVYCPFCGAGVAVYVWSFSGRGKRCPCGVMLGKLGAHDDRGVHKEASAGDAVMAPNRATTVLRVRPGMPPQDKPEVFQVRVTLRFDRDPVRLRTQVRLALEGAGIPVETVQVQRCLSDRACPGCGGSGCALDGSTCDCVGWKDVPERFCVHCPGRPEHGGHKLSCSAAKGGYVGQLEPCLEPDLKTLAPKSAGRLTAPATVEATLDGRSAVHS